MKQTGKISPTKALCLVISHQFFHQFIVQIHSIKSQGSGVPEATTKFQ